MNGYLLPFQQELADQVRLALEEVSLGRSSKGILLLGESGVGKTHALDELTKDFTPYRAGDQVVTPCIRLDVSAHPDTVAVASDGLAMLGRPVQGGRRRPAEIGRMFHEALTAQRVRLVVLEEFHNLLLRGSGSLRAKQAEFIKNLWNFNPPNSVYNWAGGEPAANRQKLVILISGTPELIDAFAPNEELASRFGTLIRASRLKLAPPESFRAFRNILSTLLARFGLDGLASSKDTALAARCYLACAGHLRVLAQTLERSASLLRSSSASPQNLNQVLASAFAQVASEEALRSNPFKLEESELTALVEAEMARQSRLKRSGSD